MQCSCQQVRLIVLQTSYHLFLIHFTFWQTRRIISLLDIIKQGKGRPDVHAASQSLFLLLLMQAWLKSKREICIALIIIVDGHLLLHFQNASKIWSPKHAEAFEILALSNTSNDLWFLSVTVQWCRKLPFMVISSPKSFSVLFQYMHFSYPPYVFLISLLCSHYGNKTFLLPQVYWVTSQPRKKQMVWSYLLRISLLLMLPFPNIFCHVGKDPTQGIFVSAKYQILSLCHALHIAQRCNCKS